MSIFIPGPAWATAIPIAVSDTVDNIGGDGNPAAIGIHNRGASAVLAHVMMKSGLVRALRITPGDTFMAGSQWCRVMATGTTASSGAAYEAIKVSSVGLAFTNQPANDGLEIGSASAADTTQTVTVYGTTNGTDTVVAETITLTGTTFVSTVKVDWGLILGIELSASCAGTVTVREASGNATVTTITTGNLSKGVETVTLTSSYNNPPTVAADGATTKQIGLIGTNAAGTVIRDSQALTGATAVSMNSSFTAVTKILTGDLETTRTVTFSVSTDLLALY